MKDWFKALFGYMAGNILSVLSFVFAAAVFYTVFWLYGVETEPVLYATLISAVILLIVFVLRFSSVYKKHKRLEKIKNDAEYAVLKLPDYEDPIKKDLADIAEKMSALKADAETRMNRKYSDSADYFTLWAHQIKTPIAAMRLLLQTDCSPENDELEEQLFKIEQYVEMVLQYIRSDSISSDLEIKSYDLGGIVRAAVKKYRKQFLRKKTKIVVGNVDCKVLTDEKWLSFVIEQLISNALKYTSEGEINIYLDENTAKTLVISDNGIGIRPEDLPRIFEKGFTGFNGREDKKSTGIGLFLCKKILTKLSHTITVTSEVGKGTAVKLCLDTVSLGVE